MRNSRVFRWIIVALLVPALTGTVRPALSQSVHAGDIAETLAGLSILYKLDAGVIGVTYGQRWLAGPTFTSTVQAGSVASVDVRVRGVDGRRNPLPIDAEWTVDEPDMVSVAPRRNSEFRITVTRAGEYRLRVGARGFAMELLVRAKDLGNAMQVEIHEEAASGPTPREDETSLPSPRDVVVTQAFEAGRKS